MEETGTAIGIYFGEDDLIMARVWRQEIAVLENQDSEPVTPAVLYMTEDHEALVGKLAKTYASTDPKNTVSGILRLIGRDFSDPLVQTELGRAAYQAVEGQNGEIEIVLQGKNYTVTELAASYFTSLKCDAEATTDAAVNQAVITVPVEFNQKQKDAVREAAQKAGLQVLRLVSEPTAVVLAYGMDQEAGSTKKLLVYDLNQCRFDATVLTVTDGKITKTGWASRTNSGGDGFNQIVVNWLVEQIRMQHQVDVTTARDASHIMFLLKSAAEGARAKLVKMNKASIHIPALTRVNDRPIDLVCDLTRDQYEAMIQSCVEETIDAVSQVLAQTKTGRDDIDVVLVAGSAARTLLVQQRLKEVFGGRVLAKADRLVYGKAMGAALATQFMPKDSTLPFMVETPSAKVEPAVEIAPQAEEPLPVEEEPAVEVIEPEISVEPVLCSCGVLNPAGRVNCCFCGENLAEQKAAGGRKAGSNPVEKKAYPEIALEPEASNIPQRKPAEAEDKTALIEKETKPAEKTPSEPPQEPVKPPERPHGKKKSSYDADQTLVDMDQTMMHSWDEEQ